MELKIICREIDKNTGRIAVYPMDTKVTNALIFRLGLRSRMNPELKYYAVELCYWLQIYFTVKKSRCQSEERRRHF